jgi:UDP-2,3-diacylglucosamine hydrolase
MKSPRLGVIAGSGVLPRLVIAACRDQERQVYVAAIAGSCEAATAAECEHGWFDIAAVGRIVEALRQHGCGEVVLAGPVSRPDLSQLRPDWQGLRLLPRVARAYMQGDDALLRTLVEFLEEEGFRVLGADQVIADLVAPAGPLGRIAPADDDRADIDCGLRAARDIGARDIGQGAVARGGRVLAVEAADGTDAMLRRCAEIAPPGRGGVLVKAAKPGQERRVDLPTIGVATVAGAVAARLKGIAVEAGAALVIDRAAVARAADEAGLFVVGIEGGHG